MRSVENKITHQHNPTTRYLLHETLLGHNIVPTPINTLILVRIPRIPRSSHPGRGIIVHICHIDGIITGSAELTLDVVIGFDLEGSTGVVAHGGGGTAKEEG